MPDRIAHASIRPQGSLNTLSAREIRGLLDSADTRVFEVFRKCALAVLNTGGELDNARDIFAVHHDFQVRVVQQPRGLKLELSNAPSSAFVDGEMIRGIQEHLFAALRDVVYTHHKIQEAGRFDLASPEGITDAVFRILRNANIVRPGARPDLVVCWGGHAIPRDEYEFSKEVGHQLGLRGFNIGTGCGIGAMKGPMKGAAIAHAKQQIRNGRYIGISEPGIIASEPPNPIVNELVILPDIEKRLEAFVRLAHAIVVFPGGVGTAEEILYLIGILMHPANKDIPFPLVFAAPRSSPDYFTQIDRFLVDTLGERVRQHYRIVVGDAAEVARQVRAGIAGVQRFRQRSQESYGFNWLLTIDPQFQQPFLPTHEAMAGLDLSRDQPAHVLAAQLRRAFSGIVAGNVKEAGQRAIEERGPYELRGEASLMAGLDELLEAFVAHRRMKIGQDRYVPCYRIAR
ncbi:MAG: nucleotide 5'-monophosphate nucleosidase PpnN [Gammaproteobacteria bacterium]